jgi:hypothetical protein
MGGLNRINGKKGEKPALKLPQAATKNKEDK